MVKRDISEIKKIVVQYVGELAKQNIRVERVILYGSYAGCTAKPYSDIDIVIISQDLERWPILERLQMLSVETLTLKAPLEVLGYTPEEIRRKGDDSIFWEEISRTGKEIYKKAA